MSRCRRAYLLPVSAVGLAALGGFLYLILPGDEDAFPDGDLQPILRQIPDEENGFLVLSAVFDRIDLPEEGGKARDPFGKGWDRRIAEEIIAKHAPVLEALEASLRSPAYQAPETYHTNPEKCRSCGKVAELASVRIRLLFDRGSEREAFVLALELLEYGHRLEGAGGPPILFIQGAGAKGKALRAMQGMLASTKLPRGELATYFDRLKGSGVHEEGWRETVKLRYRHSCEAIENHPRAKNRSWVSRVILKPNRTKRMLAEDARRVLLDGDVPPAEAGHLWWPPTNMLGRALHRLFSPLVLRSRGDRRSGNLFPSATRVMFALKCFQDDHGGLPASLDELVPGYLEEVPVDPQDNRPLEYSREKRNLSVPGLKPFTIDF